MTDLSRDFNSICSNKTNIEEVNSLNKLAMELERNKPKESLKHSSSAYKIATNIEFKEGIAQSLLRMGRSSWLLGDLEKAATHLFDAIDVIKEINNEEYKVDTLNALGNIYIDLQDYNKSLEYYIEGLKLARKINYKGMESSILNNVGEIYKELESYDEALGHYLESVSMYETIEDRKTMGIPLLNIGMVYFNLNEYEKALRYSKLSLEIFREYKDRIGEGYSLQQIGKVYGETNKCNLALEFFEQSLSVARETENKFHEIDILIDFFKLLNGNGNKEEAISYLKNALVLAEERKANKLIAEICSRLAHIYEEGEKYKNALYYYKKFHDIEMLNSDNEIQQKLKNVSVQFKMDNAQNEKEIYRLRNVELKTKTLELERAYENINIISEIGQSIISTLDLDKVLKTVYENINSLMDAECFGIGIFHDKTQTVEFKLFMDSGERIKPWTTSMNNKKSLAAWCIRNRKEVLINDIDTDYNNYLDGKYDYYFGRRPEAIIYCPLIVENIVIGMVTVQSYKKNIYTSHNVNMIKALASYIGIAIRNAQRAEMLSNLSQIDGLTEIPNRRRFDEVLKIEWTRALRYSNPISFLLIDIDRFKKYNDNYGHLYGDRAIKKVAKSLVSSIKRTTDFVGRYGGDEFVSILPNADKEGALIVAENMRKDIEKLNIENKYSDVAPYITVSIGISTLVPSEYGKWNELIIKADKALYEAKKQGSNRVETIA